MDLQKQKYENISYERKIIRKYLVIPQLKATNILVIRDISKQSISIKRKFNLLNIVQSF